jgi:hypothetical protein
MGIALSMISGGDVAILYEWHLAADGERSRATSMAQLGTRASFALLGPLVGYGIDRWGLPSVLSALGILFSIAFVFLLLPLIVRERALSPAG